MSDFKCYRKKIENLWCFYSKSKFKGIQCETSTIMDSRWLLGKMINEVLGIRKSATKTHNLWNPSHKRVSGSGHWSDTSHQHAIIIGCIIPTSLWNGTPVILALQTKDQKQRAEVTCPRPANIVEANFERKHFGLRTFPVPSFPLLVLLDV